MKNKAKMLVAAATAAAGYYFYASKNAEKNRKVAAKWAGNFKKDVLKQAKELKNLNRASFSRVVDGAAKAYEGVKNLDRKDLAKAGVELKQNWEKISEEIGKTSKAASKKMHKAVKSVRKSAQKMTKGMR